MDSNPTSIRSPFCRLPIFGRRLGVGDTLQAHDCFDSALGLWMPAASELIGIVLTPTAAAIRVWVRPAGVSLRRFIHRQR